MRLLHVVAFSKKLRWLAQTKVIAMKTQLHAVNACVKRSSQRIFSAPPVVNWPKLNALQKSEDLASAN